MISETGFWNIEGNDFYNVYHHVDNNLSSALIDLAKQLDIKKLYDFGCGHGFYTSEFNRNGINATGFDGNPITSTITNCKVQDLTDTNFNLDPVEFLMCLEVCEHVPKEFEEILITNINKHVMPGGTLVLSWAVKGQGGLGHFNEQNNDYVIDLFTGLGYSYNIGISQHLRNNSTLHWFKNTIMVFNKL